MRSLFPDSADPFRLCALGKAYRGELALALLSRLAPLLASSEGEAKFVLAFDTDSERRPIVTVDVTANLVLCCQRCMDDMTLPVRASSRLCVVAGPDEAARLPDDLDPLLVVDNRLELASVVEDELILAIPPVPMHLSKDCVLAFDSTPYDAPGSETPKAPARESPFAALAKFKRDSNEPD